MITLTDMFCGAGGSSTGAIDVPGIEVRTALNHWQLDTITAGGNHHGLMSVTEDDVMACRFRMLEPSEIKRGMAFPVEYVMLGNKREQVKLAGNAVTPPAARDLVSVVAEALGAAA